MSQPHTVPCGNAHRAARLAKARQFWEAASGLDSDDMADAFVTLCVHAGIAAADVICCARLGKHAQGQSHDDAVWLLSSADRAAAKHLKSLLGLKTAAGYSTRSISGTDRRRAKRAAAALVMAAEQA